MSTETRHARYDDWYCECGVKDCPDLAAAETAAADRARQDAADGAALRELREAVGDDGEIGVERGWYGASRVWVVTAWAVSSRSHRAEGSTLDAAARACLAAIRGGGK